MKFKHLFIIFLITFYANAQKKEIDSLVKLIQTPISDSTKIKALGDLCWYYSGISTDSSFYYGNLALELSKKTTNLNGEAQAYNDFGIIYYKLSEFDKSIVYYKKSLTIRKKINDTLGIGSLYNKMGIAYQRIFRMDSAIYYNTKALEIYEKVNNVRYVALIKNNIANIYFNLKQYKKALNEHLDVAKIRKQIGDDFGLVHSYTNLGNSYLYLKDTVKSIENYKMGINIGEAKNYERELAALYNNYGAILKDQYKTKEAISYFNKSLQIRTKLNDLYGVGSVNLNLGDLYLSSGNVNVAERFMRNGLNLAKKTNSNEQEMNAYKSLLSLFAVKRNTDSVLKYQKKYMVAQDSLFSSQITTEIAEIQEKYNTAEREKEIAQQKEQLLKNELEIKNKNLFSLLLGSGFIVFSIISFSLYKRQQHKKRAYINQLALKEAQSYNRLQDQRLRISRDLHDNIGSQLTFIISSIDNLKYLSDITNTKLHNKLSEINNFANTTISQLRDTIWAMNKNEISFEDFQGRILAFIEKAKLATNNKIQFSFNASITSEITFSSIKGINIFRVIQEAINNSIKYANASEIKINISESASELNFEISDNGCGFDVNTIDLGNGLENMQKRIDEIGGRISIDSEITIGTKISINCSKNKTNAV